MKKTTLQKLSLNKVSIVDLNVQAKVKGGVEATETGCETEYPCNTQYEGCYVTTATEVSFRATCGTGGGHGGYITGVGAVCNVPAI